MNLLITRVPRPMGLTFLATEYQKDNSEDNITKVLKHLITQWTLTGFRYCGQSLNIPELAILIKVPEDIIMRHVSQVSQSIGLFNTPDQLQDTLTSIASLSANWAIRDKGLIDQQIEILQRSQGNSYKPFISGELSKTLKIGLDANKNIMELYKTFFTQQTTNILNIYGDKDKAASDYVNPDQAFEIVLEQRNAIPAPNSHSLPAASKGSDADTHIIRDQRINDQTHSEQELDSLFKEHNLGDSPTCIEGRTGTEALRALEPDSLEALSPDNQGVMKPEGPKNNHQDFEKRRGNDYQDADEVE